MCPSRLEAVNVIRLIDTSEATYHAKRGRYATWEELAASPEFLQVKHDTDLSYHLRDTALGPAREVIPGYRLRLLTATDGSGYMLSLQETADRDCWLTFYSDERGVILEARGIGCPASK